MLSLRTAAARLSAAHSPDACAPLLAALGFASPPLPLDRAARAGLGLPGGVRTARVAAGPGALRALLVAAPADLPFREFVARCATRLSVRAPNLLWLLAAVESGARGGAAHRVALACWRGDRHPPRVATLLVDRRRVLDSDAETVCALAAAAGGDDLATHARWVEVLGRDALTRAFFRALERLVRALADDLGDAAPREDRDTLALLHVSRLLFLAFLEAKGWLDGDRAFLAHGFDRCMGDGGRYHRRVLRPLFFGTLNTPARHRAATARAFGRVPFLNGGLFAVTPVERRHRALHFGDAALGAVHGDLLARYRFTAREDSATWQEAAVDPEMLGRAFESLMAARERRASGAFFTPFALVERATALALEHALAGPEVSGDSVAAALRGERVDAAARRALAARLRGLTVLDPACGSGAFLVHALEQLALLARAAGDRRAPSEVRRELLTRAVFGVDVNPMAVWLCELRLWLAAVIDAPDGDAAQVPPLPNLDHHVRVGDALGGASFADEPLVVRGGGRALALLRERYARASGRRKARLAAELERAERARAVARVDGALAAVACRRREHLVACRSHDLFGERHRPTAEERAAAAALRDAARALRRERRDLQRGGALPFSFPVHFADVAEAGGFAVVVGNPPWVRLHRIPAADRARYRREYAVARHAAWEPGAAAAGAGAGFGAQVDLSALFTERALQLLRPGGTLALLLPAKLWRSLAGGGVRDLLAREARAVALDDYTDAPAAFDAATYPSLLVAERRAGDDDARPVRGVRVTHHRRAGSRTWEVDPAMLALDASRGSPWLVAPPDARAALDAVARRGIALATSPFGRPHLGIKSGCNDAYVVACEGVVDGVAQVVAREGRRGQVEACLLRPLLRGDRLPAWRPAPADACLLWPHDAQGAPLRALPPLAARWLAPWRRTLARRTDLHGGARWWSLFRLEGADAGRPRVVWADFGRRPRAAVLEAGADDVPLNSCYVARCPSIDDAFALAALLNGPLAAAWLNVLAEPARGGWRRYLAWTVGLLPLPADWRRAREMLAPLGRRGWEGDPPGDPELLERAAAAFGIVQRDVAALLSWGLR